MNQKLEDLKAEQGWTDETFLELVMDFIQEQGLEPALHKQLKRIADSEGDPGEAAE